MENENRIKIGIIEDAKRYANIIESLLRTIPEFEFVGAIQNGDDAETFIQGTPMNVLLLDISLMLQHEATPQRRDGLDLIDPLKAINPNLKIIILTGFESGFYLLRAIRSGAAGYLLKDNDSELAYAIKKVYDGKNYYDGSVVKEMEKLIPVNRPLGRSPETIAEKRRALGITALEGDILVLLQTMRTSEIAKRLNQTEHTINNNRSSLLKKCGVTGTAELMCYAYKNGLL